MAKEFKVSAFPSTESGRLEILLRMANHRGPAHLLLNLPDEEECYNKIHSRYLKEFGTDNSLNVNDSLRFLENCRLIDHTTYNAGSHPNNHFYNVNNNGKFARMSAEHILDWQNKKGEEFFREFLGRNACLNPNRLQLNRFKIIEIVAETGKTRAINIQYHSLGDYRPLMEHGFLKEEREEVNEEIIPFYRWNGAKQFSPSISDRNAYEIAEFISKFRGNVGRTAIFQRFKYLGKERVIGGLNYLMGEGYAVPVGKIDVPVKVVLNFTKKGEELWKRFCLPLKKTLKYSHYGS